MGDIMKCFCWTQSNTKPTVVAYDLGFVGVLTISMYCTNCGKKIDGIYNLSYILTISNNDWPWIQEHLFYVLCNLYKVKNIIAHSLLRVYNEHSIKKVGTSFLRSKSVCRHTCLPHWKKSHLFQSQNERCLCYQNSSQNTVQIGSWIKIHTDK